MIENWDYVKLHAQELFYYVTLDRSWLEIRYQTYFPMTLWYGAIFFLWKMRNVTCHKFVQEWKLIEKIIFRNRDRFYHLVLIQCEIHPFSDYKGTWKKCHVVCFHFSLTYCSRMLSTFHNGLKDVLNSHLNFSILSIFNQILSKRQAILYCKIARYKSG